MVSEFLSKNSTRLFLLSLVLILGLLLRAYAIGTQSYWLDEMFSLYVAKYLSFETLVWDSNPPLYHILLRPWMMLLGEGEAAVRLFSTLCSLGTILIVFEIGRRFFTQPIGLLAALLVALNPYSIEMAQEARMYALFEFATAINIYCFFLALTEKRVSLSWPASALLLAHVHFFSFLVLIPQVTWFLYHIWKVQKTRYYFLVYILILFGFYGISQTTGLNPEFLEWQKLRYAYIPTSADFGSLLSLVGGGSIYSFFLIAALAITKKFFEKKVITREQDFFRYFIFAMTFSILTTLFATLILHRALLLTRYMIFLVPFAALTCSILFISSFQFSKKMGLFSVSTLIVLIFFSFQSYPEIYQYRKAPWREVAQHISQFENPVVYNTRSKVLRTPYFEKKNIAVKLWDASEKTMHLPLKELDEQKNVFFLENYWGGLAYWDGLKNSISKDDFDVEENVFQIQNSDKIFVLKVKKKNK